MATIKRFEDIEAWKKARELTRELYACSKRGPFSRDFSLRDQMRRAAISVMWNIAEGFERPKQMKTANLEDVFIHLTGHSLREE